jgi:ABC-type lipoprotein export system ATPase subunit
MRDRVCRKQSYDATAVLDTAVAHVPEVVIETQELRKTYVGKIAVPVLKGINLHIQSGEFVAIIGTSGSGKSTLLNIIGALDVPTAGKVFIHGTDLASLNDDELASIRREKIGFIFQFHHLLDEFTCLENALMPLAIRHGEATREQRARVIALLQRVGLKDCLHKRPNEMSGGQNQRCALVRALANAPKIVLADEPTGNLDGRTGQEVFDLMRELNCESGVAFVMITHDEQLAQVADRRLRIEDGEVRV